MLTKIAPYAKAILAFLAPGILLLCIPLQAGRVPSIPELLSALGISLATAFAVFVTPNAKSEDEAV